ncbi:MAG: competence/damage-inducible protein A [Bacteroidota bacterium]
MKAEIITVGDEILIGQTVDTNSAWIGKAMNAAGFFINRISSISDDPGEIKSCLTEALGRVKIIIITGGLGPTKDDLTKHTLADYFGSTLVMNQAVLERVEEFFKKFDRPMLEVNRNQALLPDNCRVLDNLKGTASGMWFEYGDAVVVSLPGVPYEMEHLMETQVLPGLKAHFKADTIVHRTIMTHGIGESFLAEMVADWEDSLPAEGLKLAYLPSPGMVKLRLSAYGGEEQQRIAQVAAKVNELYTLIPDYIYGEEDEQLESVIGRLLTKNGKTLATAESCTGGNIDRLITSVAGSSVYFKGSVVAYSNFAKQQFLGIDPALLEKHGAESTEVVEQMALNALQLFQADYAVATSGLAGPGGGTSDLPVGTIFYAIASSKGVESFKQKFGSDRIRNIERSTLAVLNLLRKELVKDFGN